MENVIDSVWRKGKLLLKPLIIGGIILVLLIPTFSVQNLIQEREQRQKEATSEVSSKWSTKQNIVGPVLIVPYTTTTSDVTKGVIRKYAYFLPDELNITATVQPQERSRGIYKVILYNAQVQMSGSFKSASIEQLKIPSESILWTEAFVKLHLSDTRGLNDELKLKWNDSILTLSQQNIEGPFSGEGLGASLQNINAETLKNIQFSTNINLNGSEQILFTPVGKVTNVNLSAQWPHPSFTGNMLPQSSDITKDSFKASWKSLAHKRDFPQQWKDMPYTIEDILRERSTSSYNLASASFGTSLFIPVNGYQKTMRSVKYAILCILLTFAAFFLIDVIYKKSVHPFQYALVGLALVLFYVLLLSFSEYIGFNASYAIASVATIGLIGWFIKDVLASGRLSIILSIVLLFVYSYVFTILQLQDYALLLGSVGLFITLAIIMHFSKKIQW